MKIGIVYPEKDWTAAELALRMEVLAHDKNINVYISPKFTLKRNDALIIKKLNECKYLLLIMYDATELDSTTLSELTYTEKPKKLAFIPERARLPGNIKFENIIRYNPDKFNENYLNNLINNIQKNFKAEKAKSDILKLLFILGILLLIYYGMKANKK